MKLLHSKAGHFLLALCSGVLLTLGWPSAGFAPLLFVAMVPLLLAFEAIGSTRNNGRKYSLFAVAYTAFFVFNLLTTWWVKYASLFGAVAAVLFNALFMTTVFMLFSVSKRKFGTVTGYISLVVFWISFEYLHMNWDLSWPWLTLGNGFAGWVKMIQWYEFTGVLGGSLWIWLVNILLLKLLSPFVLGTDTLHRKKNILWLCILLFIPLSYSFFRYYTYSEKTNPVKVAIIQPNIDPYNEKFSGMSSEEQLNRILKLAETVTDPATDYVVAPETALPDGMWEEDLAMQPHIMELKKFAESFEKLTWVIGAATHSLYPDSNNRSATARRFTQSEGYYDSYNTALQIQGDYAIGIHHKSKLVPGVEKMPFPAIFKHLDNFAIDLGGISGSLGVQDTPTVFRNHVSEFAVAPVICYESVYGDYLSRYIRQGASLIFIITNDGWWSDTPGYRQHLKYATLRAIELRRSIARSANTGISCFINQRGDISQATSWWVPDAISSTIHANSELTFYARFGDVAGKFCTWMSGFILVLLLFKRSATKS